MLVKKLALTIGLVVLTSTAHADGTGVVTKINSPPNYPNCLRFQTNNGVQWYGRSLNEPSIDEDKAILNVSRLVSFPISFAPIGGGPVLDCPDSVIYIGGITW